MLTHSTRTYMPITKCHGAAHDDLGEVQARNEHLEDGVLRRRSARGAGPRQRLRQLVRHVRLTRQRRCDTAQVSAEGAFMLAKAP